MGGGEGLGGRRGGAGWEEGRSWVGGGEELGGRRGGAGWDEGRGWVGRGEGLGGTRGGAGWEEGRGWVGGGEGLGGRRGGAGGGGMGAAPETKDKVHTSLYHVATIFLSRFRTMENSAHSCTTPSNNSGL